jgi:hypothetical protein
MFFESRAPVRDVQMAKAMGAVAEGGYEQEAAAVEEDEEMEREDEQAPVRYLQEG